MKEKAKLLFYVWTTGFLGGIFFRILRMWPIKRVEVFGYKKEKFDPGEKGLILICNHPSLWEPFLLHFLFFPRYLFSLRFVPFSLPDKKNYYDKWWFWPFRWVCVPIERGNKREEIKALQKLRKMLEEGKILILHPEGGRTFKGIAKRGSKCSNSGRELARFPKGIEKLFLNLDCKILPAWVERLREKTKILIGEPFEIESFRKGRIVNYLEDVLLGLADKLSLYGNQSRGRWKKWKKEG